MNSDDKIYQLRPGIKIKLINDYGNKGKIFTVVTITSIDYNKKKLMNEHFIIFDVISLVNCYNDWEKEFEIVD